MNSVLWSLIRNNLGEILSVIALFTVWATYFITKTTMGIRDLKDSVQHLRDEVQQLTKLILDRFGRSVARTESPITLTEYGETLSKAVDAPEVVKIYAPKVKERIGDLEDMNPYEIQTHCFSYAKDELLEELKKNNKEMYGKITDYAYDNGIDIGKITRVIGIELRNKLLESLDIPQKEIDKHTPEQG